MNLKRIILTWWTIMGLMVLKLHHFLFQSSPYSNWPWSVSAAQIEDNKIRGVIVQQNLNMPRKEICCALCSQSGKWRVLNFLTELPHTVKLSTLSLTGCSQAPFCFCGTTELMLIQGESWGYESQVDSSLKWSCTSVIGIRRKANINLCW